MATQRIFGQNEIQLGTDGKATKFAGKTPYVSRVLARGASLTETFDASNGGKININDVSEPLAVITYDNEYVPMGRTAQHGGQLEAMAVSARSYLSRTNRDLGGRQFDIIEPQNARRQIGMTMDAQALLSMRHPLTNGSLQTGWENWDPDKTNLTNSAREANSVFAKAQGIANTLKGMRDAITEITSQGKRAVLVTTDIAAFKLGTTYTTNFPGAFEFASLDATVFTVPMLKARAQLDGVDTGDLPPFIVYSMDDFFTAYYNGFFTEMSGQTFDPAEPFTGNTGISAYNTPDTPATSTGISYGTNNKFGAEVYTYFDWNFLGDLALTNLKPAAATVSAAKTSTPTSSTSSN